MLSWLVFIVLMASSSDGWSNLKHVTRDRLYTVMLRDGECKYGTLSSVGDEAMVFSMDSRTGVVLKKAQIVRVSDNLTTPSRDVVFSARSSWLDVMNATPKGAEY